MVEEIQTRGGSITAVQVDTTDAASVQALFEHIDGGGRELELVAYNVGKNTPRAFLATTPELVEQVWREGPLGGFPSWFHAPGALNENASSTRPRSTPARAFAARGGG